MTIIHYCCCALSGYLASPTRWILASLGALPPNWRGTLSESNRTKGFDSLVKAGRGEELWTALRKIVQ